MKNASFSHVVRKNGSKRYRIKHHVSYEILRLLEASDIEVLRINTEYDTAKDEKLNHVYSKGN